MPLSIAALVLMLAAPAEVGVLFAAGALGRPGPAQCDDEINAVDVQEEVDETPVSTVDARLFRGVAARLNYMGPDRPDMQYAIKEAARCMARVRLGIAQEDRQVLAASTSRGDEVPLAEEGDLHRRLH